MRLRGRQARFLLLVLMGWVGLRAWAGWPGGETVPVRVAGRAVEGRRMSPAASRPESGERPRRLAVYAPPPPFASSEVEKRQQAPRPKRFSTSSNRTEERDANTEESEADTQASAAGTPAFLPQQPHRSTRWSASAYVFARPGGGRASLAAGGELGGSQAAARITYRLNRDGPVRTALAARLYAPLGGRGAEAAAGFDWHPWPQVPVRFSIERRVRLDRAGRSAWSAYAAGGFYREPLGGRLVLDGYAQAGVVGANARDLFVDGALRAGRKLALGPATLTAGAGLWGAAQPGVARLDAGPRVAAVLPVGSHALSAALEGRLRVAGRARPGSGAAVTLGVDF